MTPEVITQLTPTTQIRYTLVDIIGDEAIDPNERILTPGTHHDWLIIPDALTMWNAGYRPEFVMFGSISQAVLVASLRSIGVDNVLGAQWCDFFGDGADFRASAGADVFQYVKFAAWRRHITGLLAPPQERLAARLVLRNNTSGLAGDDLYQLKAGTGFGVRWIIP